MVIMRRQLLVASGLIMTGVPLATGCAAIGSVARTGVAIELIKKAAEWIRGTFYTDEVRSKIRDWLIDKGLDLLADEIDKLITGPDADQPQIAVSDNHGVIVLAPASSSTHVIFLSATAPSPKFQFGPNGLRALMAATKLLEEKYDRTTAWDATSPYQDLGDTIDGHLANETGTIMMQTQFLALDGGQVVIAQVSRGDGLHEILQFDRFSETIDIPVSAPEASPDNPKST